LRWRAGERRGCSEPGSGWRNREVQRPNNQIAETAALSPEVTLRGVPSTLGGKDSRLPTVQGTLVSGCERAGDGNRTRIADLEGRCSTTELHPQLPGRG
jgi:hypothetical protein